jgi:hypothetical protein
MNTRERSAIAEREKLLDELALCFVQAAVTRLHYFTREVSRGGAGIRNRIRLRDRIRNAWLLAASMRVFVPERKEP